jgi:hypothetical protein
MVENALSQADAIGRLGLRQRSGLQEVEERRIVGAC